MHTNKKGRQKAAQNTYSIHFTELSTPNNWNLLVKPGRLNRQMKRTWKRGQK